MAVSPGITLTAVLTNDSGVGIPGKVVCTLNNFGGYPPRVVGSNIIANQVTTGLADSSGNVSISLYGNYQFYQNLTYYEIAVYGTDSQGNVSNAADSCGNYQFLTGGTFDLSNLIPIGYPVIASGGGGGSTVFTVSTENANFVAAANFAYEVTTGSSVITATLPSASGVSGQEIIVKKVDAGAGSVTVAGTIDGSTNYFLTNQWQYVRLMSDGSNWIVTGNN